MRSLQTRTITPLTGVEILDLDLSTKLDDDTVSAIRTLLLERCVPAQQVAFAKNFGHVPKVPDSMFLVHPESSHVSVLHNDAERPPTVNNWHSDYSFAALPDLGSVLYAEVVPEHGGDTVWCNTYAAYEGLSERMKHYLEGLGAVHDFMKLYERPIKRALWEGPRAELMEAAREQFPPVVHPIVRAHPESGRKALFVNESFTRHVEDMGETESRWLLGYLFEHMRAPEYQLRFSWQEGDVAFWDNRSTNHYAVADFHPEQRHMHRVTVLERPREN